MKTNRTNRLDEMQDQKLLKLEEAGFWILFWALSLAILVQLLTGGSFRQIAGELIVLAIGSIWLAVTTLKNGIWTRESTPTRKGSALASIIPAVLIGAIHVFKLNMKDGLQPRSLLITAGISAAVYALCFGILELFRAAYNKRRSALDNIPDEESET